MIMLVLGRLRGSSGLGWVFYRGVLLDRFRVWIFVLVVTIICWLFVMVLWVSEMGVNYCSVLLLFSWVRLLVLILIVLVFSSIGGRIEWRFFL